MFTLNARIEDHTIAATSQDGHTFAVTFADTLSGQESQHTMSVYDLTAVYSVAMLGDEAPWEGVGDVAQAWYALNPDAVRVIP